MVLFKIDVHGITILPFKRDPPRPVHRERVAHRLGVQCVQPPSGDAQVIERFGTMNCLQSRAHPLHQVGTNAARIIGDEKVP